VAAFNSFYNELNPDDNTSGADVSRYTFNGRNYAWGMQSGTSMSCPMVAGIIAQWMEAVPTLTREQVLEVFEATCKRHDPLRSYPNNDYGYGEIDAEAGLEYLMGHYTLTPTLSKREGEKCVYDLSGRRVERPSRGLYIVSDVDGNRKKVLLK